MTGTQLRCFLAAAKYLNFTTAAAALYLTQPTLSKNIAALEQELGLSLFYRTRRGLRLTPGGLLLRDRLSPMAEEFDDAVAEARLANLGASGHLALGFLTGQMISPRQREILCSFESAHPGIPVTITSGSFGRLIDGLRSGELDAAFTAAFSVEHEAGLLYESVEKLSNALFLHRSNPLAQKEPLLLTDLRSVPFLSVTTGDTFAVTQNYQHTCRKAGFEPIILEAPDLSTMILWLEMGRGVTVLNDQHTVSLLPQLAARTMPEFAPITLCLSWFAGNENPALSLFLEHWNRSCADPARK